MGRFISQATTSSATVEALTSTLGNVNTNIRDYTTISATVTTLPNGERWAMSASASASYFTRNSIGEQNISTSNYGVLQDELSDYTYIQSLGGLPSSGAYVTVGAVYDAGLTPVYSWNANNRPYAGELFCVRLHNSNLYFFSCPSTNGIRITKIALPSGTKTTFSSLDVIIDSPYALYNSLVFNWTINNKFWMFISNASYGTNAATYVTFDLATETFAQFGTTRAGTSSDYLASPGVMHVKADGSAVSTTVYNPLNGYGVFSATSSASTYTLTYPTGHYIFNGTYSVWSSLPSNAWKGVVTTDAAIDSSGLRYTSSYYYRTALPHLQGGDTAVQLLDIEANVGLGAGIPPYNYPLGSSGPTPNVSATTRNKAQFQIAAALGGTGRFPVSRNGTTLVIGTKESTAFANGHTSNFVASKLPDSIKVRPTYTYLNSASVAYLDNILIWDNNAENNYAFTQSAGIEGQNRLNNYTTYDPWPTSFVTSSGKYFAIPHYTNSSNTYSGNFITASLPIYKVSKTSSYKVTVIGGGGNGGVSASNGTSSSFSTSLAAANGVNRGGFNPGSFVFSSGSAVNTGGKGLGADEWGKGEDSNQAGYAGGGSGYVTFGTLSLTAGTAYVYKAGLGPAYGKQGAILIQEASS